MVNKSLLKWESQLHLSVIKYLLRPVLKVVQFIYRVVAGIWLIRVPVAEKVNGVAAVAGSSKSRDILAKLVRVPSETMTVPTIDL